MSADGTATVVWKDGVVVAAQRPWGSSVWSGAQPISSSVADPSSIELATDAGGKAIAVWVSYGVVQAAVRPAGGGWQTSQNLSLVGAELPRVTIGGQGDAVVVWGRAIDANSVIVEATLRPTGGYWTLPPAVLSDSAHWATQPDVTLDADGNALVAWSDFDGFNSTIGYSVHDVGAPSLSGLSVPASATVGQPVGVAVNASDRWSGVAGSPAWDFGDGASAAGATATHVYAQPGTYALTVSAGDGAGNVARASRPITVAPAATTPETGPGPTPGPGPARQPGTTGTVAGVTVTLPGASAGSTPLPSTLSKAALRKLPKVRVSVQTPKRIRSGQKTIIHVGLSRPVHGALATVQLRRGVTYRTVARGRVSGRRVPVALVFRAPGKYLLRVQIREAGKTPVTKVVALTVR
jgi:hypothetical protein